MLRFSSHLNEKATTATHLMAIAPRPPRLRHMRRSALVAARRFSTRVDAVNPYTGSLAASFPADDDLALARKFVRANEAQARWRETPMRERVACVERYAELLRGEADAAALELTTEMGKPLDAGAF